MIYKYKINYKSIGGSSSSSSTPLLTSSTSTSSSSSTPLLTSSTSSSSTSSSSTKNVLFACTTLHKNSTLSENFTKINELVRSDLEDKLQAHFVYKYPQGKYKLIQMGFDDDIMSKYLKPILENNGYIIKDPEDINLVDFLRENVNLKFDKIILTQCNEIVTIITGDEIEPSYSLIFENLKQIYSSLKDNGVIINYYYGINNELCLSSFSNTLAPVTLDNFPYVLFILILIDKFFESSSVGIYRKKSNVDVDSIDISKIEKQLNDDFDKTKNYTTVEEYNKFLFDSINNFSSSENNTYIIELIKDIFENLKLSYLKNLRKKWNKLF